MVEVDRVDVGEVDERLDVDRPRLARRGGRELGVGEDDQVAVVGLEAAGDLLVGNLGVLLGAEAVDLDRRVVLGVDGGSARPCRKRRCRGRRARSRARS
jgi:hypothetical protein